MLRSRTFYWPNQNPPRYCDSMKLKLYDGAWVELARYGPQVLRIECAERRLYRSLNFVYREDGRPAPGFGEAPVILLIYSRGCFRAA